MALLDRLLGGPDQPIADGIRGDAVVLESVACLPELLTGRQVGGWSRWRSSVALQIRIPGRPVWYPTPTMWFTRAKYPVAGTVVPVTVDRIDPSRALIMWDELPTIDEWIAAGHPIFTDTDTVERFWREAEQGRISAAVAQADQNAAATAEQFVGPGGGEQVQRALAGVRAGLPPEPGGLQRRVIKGASARVVAVGWQNSEDEAAGVTLGRAEMLLSVAVPGKPRYGVRWHGWIPRRKIVTQWWDLPVTVDRHHPTKVKINWDDAGGFDVVAERMRQATDQMEARLAASSQTPTVDAYKGLLSSIADPARRAQAEQQIAQALNPSPSPDPLAELERLGKLRAAGAISEADFAAQKAHILANM